MLRLDRPHRFRQVRNYRARSASQQMYRTIHLHLNQRIGGVPASTERNDRIGLSRSAAVLQFQFESVVVTAEFHPLHPGPDTDGRLSRFHQNLGGPDQYGDCAGRCRTVELQFSENAAGLAARRRRRDDVAVTKSTGGSDRAAGCRLNNRWNASNAAQRVVAPATRRPTSEASRPLPVGTRLTDSRAER